MSVENLTIAAVVEEGSSAMRKLYAAGITAADFVLYDDEFKWIERRLIAKKTLNRRVFRQRFPDFEWALPREDIKDLASELREERAFEEVNTLVATLANDLRADNAVELANTARETLSRITRQHSPMSDVVVEDWQGHITDMKNAMKLAKMGKPVGIQTGISFLDHHWGGLLPGQSVLVLGRTGEGKSYKTTIFALNAKMQNAKVGVFTPEMSPHEVRCRLHTLASAIPEVQKAVGLDRSFRNRALLFKRGFNIKSYERFCRYFDEVMPGRIHILSGVHRREQMTVGYIEDRIVELGLDLVIIDPIYLLKPVRTYRDNPYAEIGSVAEAVEALSETYNIPVVMTNQAHRQGGAQGDAPHKDKSFGSDLPAQLADYVLGVKHISEENRMICRCTKSRFGQEFRYEMKLLPNTGVYDVLTPLSGNYFNGKDDDFDRELQDAIAESGGVKMPKKGSKSDDD